MDAVASGWNSVCRVKGVCVLDATYVLTAVSALPPGLAEAEPLRCAHAVPVAPPLPAVGAVLVLARLAVEAWLADAEPDLVAVSAVAAAVDAAGLVADLARPRDAAVADALDAVPVARAVGGAEADLAPPPPEAGVAEAGAVELAVAVGPAVDGAHADVAVEPAEPRPADALPVLARPVDAAPRAGLLGAVEAAEGLVAHALFVEARPVAVAVGGALAHAAVGAQVVLVALAAALRALAVPRAVVLLQAHALGARRARPPLVAFAPLRAARPPLRAKVRAQVNAAVGPAVRVEALALLLHALALPLPAPPRALVQVLEQATARLASKTRVALAPGRAEHGRLLRGGARGGGRLLGEAEHGLGARAVPGAVVGTLLLGC